MGGFKWWARAKSVKSRKDGIPYGIGTASPGLERRPWLAPVAETGSKHAKRGLLTRPELDGDQDGIRRNREK
jgi:hypothetical protein